MSLAMKKKEKEEEKATEKGQPKSKKIEKIS